MVGKDTYERLTAFLDYITDCRKDWTPVIEHFHEYLEMRAAGEDVCPECGVELRGTDGAPDN